MNKFFAVVKREYLQRVRSRLFVVMTVLGPLLLAVFTVVPGFLMTIKTGDTRVAIVDQNEGSELYQSLRDALLRGKQSDPRITVTEAVNSNAQERMERAGRAFIGSFRIEQVATAGRSIDEIKRELNARIGKDELEG